MIDDNAAHPRSRKKRRRLPRWPLLFALVVAGSVYFLFFWGKERKSWREEVQLVDGSRIEIQRRLTLEKTWYELGQAGMRPTLQRLRLPDGVTFETDDRLILLHLERGNFPTRWTLLASPATCESFEKYGRPKPDYLQFEYVDQRWSYRGVQPEYYGRTVNLLVSDRGISDDTHVAHSDKSDHNSAWKGIAPAYLRIDGDFNSVCRQATYGVKK